MKLKQINESEYNGLEDADEFYTPKPGYYASIVDKTEKPYQDSERMSPHARLELAEMGRQLLLSQGFETDLEVYDDGPGWITTDMTLSPEMIQTLERNGFFELENDHIRIEIEMP